MDSIIKNVILTLEKLDEDCFNSPQRKALYYPKGTYSRTIITLFWEVTFKRCAYVDKNGKNHFYYLDSLLIFHLVLFSIMMLLMNFYSLPENILLILLLVKYLVNIFLRMIFLQIKVNIFLVLLSLTILNVLISMPSSPSNKIRLKTFLSNLMNIMYLFKSLRSLLILLKNKWLKLLKSTLIV